MACFEAGGIFHSGVLLRLRSQMKIRLIIRKSSSLAALSFVKISVCGTVVKLKHLLMKSYHQVHELW